jgi:hypothetical protein
MPDDRQPPPAGSGSGEPDPPPDATREFRPGAADDPQADPHPAAGDDTAVGPPAGDETVVGPRAGDETVVGPPAGDETVVGPPAVSATQVWSGRAEVPPAGVRPAGPATAQWEQPPAEDPGRWWMPIVIGLVGLLLLGVLGYGLWLIGAAEDEPGPAPSTRPATTAPPSTRPPTTDAPEPTEAEEVEVPGLAGQSLPDAQDRLDELGLAFRVSFEVTDDEEPGTVIRTRPDEGSRVAPGTQVTLVVATSPEETETPEPSPSEGPPPSGD